MAPPDVDLRLIRHPHQFASVLTSTTLSSAWKSYRQIWLGLCLRYLPTRLRRAIDRTVGLHIDATAAKGIIERKGLNKLRHVETDILWLQEQAARRVLPLTKVLGTVNVADLMTNNLPAASINRYVEQMCLEFASGRSTIA